MLKSFDMYTLANYGVEKIEQTLKNGLKVVFIKKPFSPVFFEFTMRAGAAYDPVGLEGLAHFSEHMLVSGSSTHSKESFSLILDSVGGMWNAQTGRYSMDVICEVATKDQFARVKDFYQHALLDFSITDSGVEEEKKIIISEIERAQSNNDRKFSEFLGRVSAAGTRFEYSVLGTIESVSRITADDVRNFLTQSVSTENSVLVVCGGCEFSDIENIFGDMQFSSGTKRTLPAEPLQIQNGATPAHVTIDTPQTKIVALFAGPHPDSRDSYLLNFALSYAHSGLASLFYRRIRNEKQLAYSLGSFGSSFDTFEYIGTSTGVPTDRVAETIEAIRDCYRELVATGMTQEQVLETAHKKYFQSIRTKQEVSDWVNIYSSDSLYPRETPCGDFPDIHNYRLTYTPEEISEVLKKYIIPDQMNIVAGGR